MKSSENDVPSKQGGARRPRRDPELSFALGLLAIAGRQQDKRHYGQSKVAAIAAAFHLKEDSLYDCVLVARMWSAAEFRELVTKTGPFGFRLSFSHFVAAARWSNSRRGPSSRYEARRAVEMSLELRRSVRQLKKTLNAA